MSKAWFVKWFDSKYYHLLYSYRDENEAKSFMKNLVDFLKPEKDAKIIDIACGRGRHAKILNDLGYDVTGIDIAPSNIDFARKYESDHLHFFCHDKRKVFKHSGYDFALNLFTSFGYLRNRHELEMALQAMVSNLKPGGKLVLDYLNAAKIGHESFHTEEINTYNVNFRVHKHIEGHQILKEINIEDGKEHFQFVEKVHLITLEEFQSLFEEASLKILHTFGDYNLGPYEPESSIRLILIAEKQ